MDLIIPEELRMLQILVKRFTTDQLMPLESQVIREDGLRRDDEAHLDQLTRDLGLWAYAAPAEYGGGNVAFLGQVLVTEELSKSIVPFEIGGNPDIVLYACNAEQRERFLLPIIRGEKTCCFALTEPNAGSDAGAIETKAIRDGDHFVVNGTKTLITRGDSADFAIVFVVTDAMRRSRGISCLLIERETPGYVVSKVIPTMGYVAPVEIAFVDCVVPATNLLGAEGLGFVTAQRWLETARLMIAPRSIGAAERALDMAVDYAKQRVTFGKALAERQAVQWMIADTAVDIHAARLMTYDAAWKADQGNDIRFEAAAVKLFATEMVGRAVDRALQIYGGMGYTKELPLEWMYRNTRLSRVAHGTSEILRYLIARTMFRG